MPTMTTWKQYQFKVHVEHDIDENETIVYENDKGEKYDLRTLNKHGYYVICVFGLATIGNSNQKFAICEMRY